MHTCHPHHLHRGMARADSEGPVLRLLAEEVPHVVEHALHGQVYLAVALQRLQAAGELPVEHPHHRHLDFGRLRDAQVPHERGGGACVDRESQEGNAAHIKQHPIRIAAGDLAVGPAHGNLDGKRQANGAAQAAPSHHQGIGRRHGLSVGAEQLQQWPGQTNHDPSDEHEGRVDDEKMDVVNPWRAEHDAACERAGKEEDDRVAQVFKRVPHGVHRFMANNLWPHEVREHQRRRDCGQHAADVEDAFRDDEARESASDCQGHLDDAAVVIGLLIGGANP
mmetsp:Transcript_27465/g.79600  ORF Transcript_27465/g.79600 Transcript_27465/m.79600 type:complete len:279 (-) Transcript_27465:1090-1926(-)